MLILSRKLNEKIFVGDNIEIMVVELYGGLVRLGIKAPREVPIYREELLSAASRELIRKEVGGERETE